MSDIAYQIRKRERFPFPPMNMMPMCEVGSAGTIPEISGTVQSPDYIDLIVPDRRRVLTIAAAGITGALERNSAALSGGNTAWLPDNSLTGGSPTIETVVYGGLASGVSGPSVFTVNAGSWQIEDVVAAILPAASSTPDQFQMYAAKFGSPNWDGYGASAIEASTIEAARSFLAMLPSALGPPDVAPGADGTIGLEWAFRDRPVRKLFIDVGPGNNWSGYWRRTSGEKGSFTRRPIDAATRKLLINLFDTLTR
jgi:hypothetical protein